MESDSKRSGASRTRRWIRRGFLVWALVSTSFLLNTFRTRGVPGELLASDAAVTVRSSRESLAFLPNVRSDAPGLVFLCGAGVSADAYAPLLRPIAEKGCPVFIVRLPWRIAPLESHKQAAIRRALSVIEGSEAATSWVLAGHSLGAALASRIAAERPAGVRALVLVGTTHPKSFSLAASPIPTIKILGTHDGVAPREKIYANRHLLPLGTRWVEIEGGNHSQFGHYGHQLFDGSPTVSRERQQEITRAALLSALESTKGNPLP